MIIKIKVYIHELLGGCVIMILHDKLLIVYLEKSILREVYIIKSIYDCHISCMTIPFYTITYISWNDLNEQKHAKKGYQDSIHTKNKKIQLNEQHFNLMFHRIFYSWNSVGEMLIATLIALMLFLLTRKNLFKTVSCVTSRH